MSECKVPDYISGRKGSRYGISLRVARDKGAAIIVEDSGEAVMPTVKGSYRPWVGIDSGYRYASRECIPVW